MTWKSTVFVSGAGLLATWLASVPAPAPTPVQTSASAPAARPASAPTAVSSEIAYEADRLERRNTARDDYDRPARNLFRFGPVRSLARTTAVAARPVPIDVNLAPAVPQLAVHLSGVAMDRVGDRDVWTAILSTPAGLLLAHQGDEITGGWTIATIEAESVALTRPDGSMLMLPLSGK